VIRFISPIFTAILARLFLKEEFGFVQVCASFSCLAGVVLVAQPAFLFDSWNGTSQTHSEEDAYRRSLGTVCSLAAAVVGSCVFISIRKVGTKCHYFVFVFSYGVATTSVGLLGLLCSVHTISCSFTFSEWMVLLALTLISFVDQTLSNAGAQLAPAGLSTLVRNIEIISAYVFGIALFHEQPNVLSFVGGFIVLSSVGGIVLWKWFKSK
jgi:drug/metabolite transporter (DMT)-like permease